jgi:hypothetical protein
MGRVLTWKGTLLMNALILAAALAAVAGPALAGNVQFRD